MGRALMAFYIPSSQWDPRNYSQIIDELFRLVEHGALPPRLFGGILGVGWTVAHLARVGIGHAQAVDLSDLDDFALEWLALPDDLHHFDLIAGVTGAGVYALERSHAAPERARTLSAAVLDRLESMSHRTRDGCAWFTPPQKVSPFRTKTFPQGAFDLGIAHGTPGVLGLASRMCRRFHDGGWLTLLSETARWLRTVPMPEGRQVLGYPTHLYPDGETYLIPQTIGWCYGDLGVACSLLHAADALDCPTTRKAGVAAARACIGKSVKDDDPGGPLDTTLCHGSQGVAHVFLRLHSLTGVPEFLDEAVRWTRRTIDALDPAAPFAGVRIRTRVGDGWRWQTKQDVLQGAAGVALSLFTLLSGVEPTWDRLLLTDFTAA